MPLGATSGRPRGEGKNTSVAVRTECWPQLSVGTIVVDGLVTIEMVSSELKQLIPFITEQLLQNPRTHDEQPGTPCRHVRLDTLGTDARTFFTLYRASRTEVTESRDASMDARDARVSPLCHLSRLTVIFRGYLGLFFLTGHRALLDLVRTSRRRAAHRRRDSVKHTSGRRCLRLRWR